MRPSKWWLVLVGMLLAVGCTLRGPLDGAEDDGGGADDGSGSGASTGSGETSTGSGAGSTGTGPNVPTTTAGSGAGPSVGHTGVTTSAGSGGSGATSGVGGGTSTSGSSTSGTSGAGGSLGVGGGGSGVGGSGGSGGNGCYTEGYNPSNSVADLVSGYQGNQWLDYMLETLNRRYTNGFVLMDAMKGDPWLTGQFPGYFNLNSWDGMAESIDTACHEETHGYDFDQALNLPGQHLYYMGENLEVVADELDFFARNVILSDVQAGGSVTSTYDSTYLTGTQGSYDFIFLADELTSYINGLACAVAVADQLDGSGYSYRDGAASHLYYLLIYLRKARTSYPTLYAQWKADADWQQFVRYSWARGHFWTNASAPHSHLGINDAAIWQRINQQANLDEILQFTGDDAATVACTP